jgi:hypothetical protein
VDAARKNLPAFYFIAQGGGQLACFLRRLRIVPELRVGDLFI